MIGHLDKKSADEWYTPRGIVEVIVPYLKKMGYRHILCPYDEQTSNFVSVLEQHGFDVSYSHINTGTDFFDLNFDGYDAVVSNPPYSKRQEVLVKMFNQDVPFAMIMNIHGLFNAKSRWDLFKNNEFSLLIPRERWRFVDKNGIKGGSPQFQSIYVCKGMGAKQIEFINT